MSTTEDRYEDCEQCDERFRGEAIRRYLMETRSGRVSPTVDVGGVLIGSQHPVVVQSMTNTDTEDIRLTATQIAELARAGSELVRITVNTANAAACATPLTSRVYRRKGRGILKCKRPRYQIAARCVVRLRSITRVGCW